MVTVYDAKVFGRYDGGTKESQEEESSYCGHCALRVSLGHRVSHMITQFSDLAVCCVVLWENKEEYLLSDLIFSNIYEGQQKSG